MKDTEIYEIISNAIHDHTENQNARFMIGFYCGLLGLLVGFLLGIIA